MKDFQSNENFKLLTLDIENMFPSIPLESVIDSASDILLNKFGTATKQEIIKLLKFCTTDMCFNFGDFYYKQKNGVTMGSPLAPILAELFLLDIEKRFIYNNNFLIKNFFYYRYVDDIFMIIPDKISEQIILNYFNILSPQLKFTMEIENKNTINFLDVLIEKSHFKIFTSWFRKDSNTLNFTDWNSIGPKHYKINLVKTMINRLRKICSDKNILKKDLWELKLSFIRSNYPIMLLNKLFSKNRIIKPLAIASQKEFFLGVKFYNNRSVKFARSLSKIVNKYFGFVKIVTYFPSGKKLINYFSQKIKNNNFDTCMGVYQIPCNDCNLKYIGETGRAFKIRIKEHEANCRNHSNYSAVVNHSDSGHSLNFSSSKIIYSESHVTRRKIAEALLINQQSHVMDGNINSHSLKIFVK